MLLRWMIWGWPHFRKPFYSTHFAFRRWFRPLPASQIRRSAWHCLGCLGHLPRELGSDFRLARHLCPYCPRKSLQGQGQEHIRGSWFRRQLKRPAGQRSQVFLPLVFSIPTLRVTWATSWISSSSSTWFLRIWTKRKLVGGLVAIFYFPIYWE